MVLQISVKDDKAELFLQLIEELKTSMIDKFDIVPDNEAIFDTNELLKRSTDIHDNKLKPLTRTEVFDGIC